MKRLARARRAVSPRRRAAPAGEPGASAGEQGADEVAQGLEIGAARDLDGADSLQELGEARQAPHRAVAKGRPIEVEDTEILVEERQMGQRLRRIELARGQGR